MQYETRRVCRYELKRKEGRSTNPNMEDDKGLKSGGTRLRSFEEP